MMMMMVRKEEQLDDEVVGRRVTSSVSADHDVGSAVERKELGDRHARQVLDQVDADVPLLGVLLPELPQFGYELVVVEDHPPSRWIRPNDGQDVDLYALPRRPGIACKAQRAPRLPAGLWMDDAVPKSLSDELSEAERRDLVPMDGLCEVDNVGFHSLTKDETISTIVRGIELTSLTGRGEKKQYPDMLSRR